MARIKLTLPQAFPFAVSIPVRITDINYGGHVGNDAILSLIHESRMRFLKDRGYSELDMAGTSLIMSDVAIEFRNELFYGDTVRAFVAAGEFTRAGFELYYKLVKEDAQDKVVALAKTGMVCFDYKARRVTAVPEEAITRLTN